MFRDHARWYISASWMVLVLVAFLGAEATSDRGVLMMVVTALLPPAVMLVLWHGRAPLTIAEVLRNTEQRP